MKSDLASSVNFEKRMAILRALEGRRKGERLANTGNIAGIGKGVNTN